MTIASALATLLRQELAERGHAVPQADCEAIVDRLFDPLAIERAILDLPTVNVLVETRH